MTPHRVELFSVPVRWYREAFLETKMERVEFSVVNIVCFGTFFSLSVYIFIHESS